MMRSKKAYTCPKCNQDSLYWSWSFDKQRPILVDDTGARHFCHPDDSITPGRCKFCDAENLVWIRQDKDEYQLTESYGLPHYCDAFVEYVTAYKEAYRENYLFEKRWVNSFPDGYECPKCAGRGFKLRKGRKSDFPVRGPLAKKCKTCKGVGTFSASAKLFYLAALRKKYWPYPKGKRK